MLHTNFFFTRLLGAGRDFLADTLTARGAHVTRVDCYRRARPQAAPRASARHGASAASMRSRSPAAKGWITSGNVNDGRSELAATPAFVSHPRIAERAHALKLARVIVAEPTDAGLIASLLQYFDADS